MLVGEHICFIEHLEGVGLVAIDHGDAGTRQPTSNCLVDETKVTRMLEILFKQRASLLKFVPLVMHFS
ncbi:hypothetical protein D3C80_1879820 [compost metagenome]